MKITTSCNSLTAYERNHGVVDVLKGAKVRVIAFTAAQVPGDSSVLGTAGMTIARSGSSGWSPPS